MKVEREYYKKTGIYVIVNSADEKDTVYVGSTARGFGQRCRSHKSKLNRNEHNNSHLQNAWNKYGADAFSFVIAEIVDDVTLVIAREQYWMDKFSVSSPLYNHGPLAEHPMLGTKMSTETKQKLSRVHTGKIRTEQHCLNLGRALKGIPKSEEHKRKLSRALVGNKCATRKKYPAFRNVNTGEIIPAGINLAELCRHRGLRRPNMCQVKNGQKKSHQGWVLYHA